VQVLGIGVDHPFAQKALADSLKLPYPLLSDFFGLNVIKQYGVLYPATGQYAEWAGRAAKRHFFLIDRKGIVRGKWMGEDMAVFSNEEILKAARQLTGTR
jgi:peroxiredoxin (alkyl hydroperoxide reductase subunit C)